MKKAYCMLDFFQTRIWLVLNLSSPANLNNLSPCVPEEWQDRHKLLWWYPGRVTVPAASFPAAERMKNHCRERLL